MTMIQFIMWRELTAVEQFRGLVDNLAFAYLFNRQLDVSKYYYEKEGTIVYYYYNMACMESLDKKTKEALAKP